MPKWTPDQQTAIDDRGGALLVSAAAGSGKTAVLTERVLRRLTDENDPVDIDRLLLQYTAELPESLVAEASDHIRFHQRQLSAVAAGPSFSAGQRISHPIFGDGAILAIDREASTYTVQFDDIPTPRSISFRVRITPL